MAKYGLFDTDSTKPKQEYEGDSLSLSGDTVIVSANDEKGHTQTVAVIRLAERQSVKKVKSGQAA